MSDTDRPRAMQRYVAYAPSGHKRVTELSPAAATAMAARPGWAIEHLGPSRVTIVDEAEDTDEVGDLRVRLTRARSCEGCGAAAGEECGPDCLSRVDVAAEVVDDVAPCASCGRLIDRFGAGPWWHVDTMRTTCESGAAGLYARP